MSSLTLVQPSMAWKEEYLQFFMEWKESGETMIPWVISKDPSSFEKMLDFLGDNEKIEKQPIGWVCSSTYWIVLGDKTIVGAVNIRHALTEKLRNQGGHIGYGIRPSERRKGYATRALALSLKKAQELGIKDVLVVCDHDNIGSRKTIMLNGGIADESFVEEDGNIIDRFWIRL